MNYRFQRSSGSRGQGCPGTGDCWTLFGPLLPLGEGARVQVLPCIREADARAPPAASGAQVPAGYLAEPRFHRFLLSGVGAWIFQPSPDWKGDSWGEQAETVTIVALLSKNKRNVQIRSPSFCLVRPWVFKSVVSSRDISHSARSGPARQNKSIFHKPDSSCSPAPAKYNHRLVLPSCAVSSVIPTRTQFPSRYRYVRPKCRQGRIP